MDRYFQLNAYILRNVTKDKEHRYMKKQNENKTNPIPVEGGLNVPPVEHSK